MYNEKYFDTGEVVAIDSMKRNIKTLGQKRVLEIINGNGLVLNDEQRKAYKRIFFKVIHILEG